MAEKPWLSVMHSVPVSSQEHSLNSRNHEVKQVLAVFMLPPTEL